MNGAHASAGNTSTGLRPHELAVADGDDTAEVVGHLDAAAALSVAVRGLPPGQAVHVCVHAAYSSATDSIRVKDASGDSAAALARSYVFQWRWTRAG